MDIFWSWILRSWLPWYVSYQHYDAFIIQQSFFSKNWKQFEWNTDLNGRERGWKETKNCSTWQNISYSLNNNPTHNMETRVKHNICPSLPFLLTCPLVSRQIINNKSIKLSFFSSSSSSPQLYLWGSPFWVRFLCMWLFSNPTIEVDTLRLCG